MSKKTLINWFRRILSTAVMMSVFFIAFTGGLAVFFYGDFLRGFIALVWVIGGLIISRLLWI